MSPCVWLQISIAFFIFVISLVIFLLTFFDSLQNIRRLGYMWPLFVCCPWTRDLSVVVVVVLEQVTFDLSFSLLISTTTTHHLAFCLINVSLHPPPPPSPSFLTLYAFFPPYNHTTTHPLFHPFTLFNFNFNFNFKYSYPLQTLFHTKKYILRCSTLTSYLIWAVCLFWRRF